MPKEPRAVQEIHEIRERLQRERAGMSTEEYIASVNREGAAIAKKLGLKRVPGTQVASASARSRTKAVRRKTR